MAERLKDNEDIALEALFRSEPVADDGFSQRIVGKIRRQIWARRVTLPLAVFLGSAVAAKPVANLLGNMGELMNSVPGASSMPIDSLPSVYMLIGGGMLLALVLFGLNMLEE